MKKMLLGVVALLGLSGCSDDPLTIMQTDGIPVAVYHNGVNACIGSSSTLDRVYIVSVHEYSSRNDDNTWTSYTDYRLKSRCVNGAVFSLKYTEEQSDTNSIDATTVIAEESY